MATPKKLLEDIEEINNENSQDIDIKAIKLKEES